MRELGSGAYGRVVTDGKLAYKFLHCDPHLEHYTRFFKALLRLSQSGIGDDIRPMLKRQVLCGEYASYTRPCIVMPIYGPTLFDLPPSMYEQDILADWLFQTIAIFHDRGVCHRDMSSRNVARRMDTGAFVLLDLDSCFVIDDAPTLKPENGVYCPFFGYPADVLPRPLIPKTYSRAVCLLTMWFSAQCLYNICVLGHPPNMYTPDARPPRFFGVAHIFHRVRAIANILLPGHIIDQAQAQLTFYNDPHVSGRRSATP